MLTLHQFDIWLFPSLPEFTSHCHRDFLSVFVWDPHWSIYAHLDHEWSADYHGLPHRHLRQCECDYLLIGIHHSLHIDSNHPGRWAFCGYGDSVHCLNSAATGFVCYGTFSSLGCSVQSDLCHSCHRMKMPPCSYHLECFPFWSNSVHSSKSFSLRMADDCPLIDTHSCHSKPLLERVHPSWASPSGLSSSRIVFCLSCPPSHHFGSSQLSHYHKTVNQLLSHSGI